MGYERDLYALITMTVAAGVMTALLMLLLRRRSHRACVWCRYNLTGLPEGTTCCPECGKPFAKRRDASAEQSTPRSSRLKIIATVLLLAALIGGLLADISVYRDMGHWQAPSSHWWGHRIEPRLWPKPYYRQRPERLDRSSPHVTSSPNQNHALSESPPTPPDDEHP